MAEYSSGTGRSYVPPAPGGYASGKTGAYADALRNYSQNSFAGAASGAAPAMAEHLSRAPDLDPDILAAYKQASTDYGSQSAIPNVEKLWRLSPKSPMFQAGYQHDPIITSYVAQLRDRRRPEYAEEQRQRELAYEQPGQGGT